jgi:hypothetical protein
MVTNCCGFILYKPSLLPSVVESKFPCQPLAKSKEVAEGLKLFRHNPKLTLQESVNDFFIKENKLIFIDLVKLKIFDLTLTLLCILFYTIQLNVKE